MVVRDIRFAEISIIALGENVSSRFIVPDVALWGNFGLVLARSYSKTNYVVVERLLYQSETNTEDSW